MQFKIISRIHFASAVSSVAVVLSMLLISPTWARSGPREGLPGRRVSGGSRQPVEACVVGAEPLVALMPESNLALTTETQTKLWFHLPEVASSRQLEFKLYDGSSQIYGADLAVPAASGVVGVDLDNIVLADGSPALQTGKAYRWTFAIVCDVENRSEDHWVEGWVERVDEATAVSAATADWLLHIDRLIEQTQGSPAAFVGQWRTLLQAIGLEQIVPTSLAAAPVVLQPMASPSAGPVASTLLTP